MEKALVALADDGRKTGRVGTDRGGGERRERQRKRVERSGQLVDLAVQQTVHRTASMIAEDVVSEVMSSVSRQLLMRDKNTAQTR